MLGNEDGRLICRELKNTIYADTPILLYSAAAALLINFREYKADETVEKPFDIHFLREKVNQLVAG